MLDDQIFKTVISSVLLVSIDILLKRNNKVLSGKRVNKNETIDSAMNRIAKDELNIELKTTLKFIGVFEHFYDDSIYGAYQHTM